jgi:hypothetical protein
VSCNIGYYKHIPKSFKRRKKIDGQNVKDQNHIINRRPVAPIKSLPSDFSVKSFLAA